MSSTRIETELAAVSARIQKLQEALEKERAWQEELATSLRVLRRLGDTERNAEEILANIASNPSLHGFEHVNTTIRRRGRSPTVDRAEQALVSMLREKGDFIRQLDAVNRLRDEHRIVVGHGVPGRETSDLSAALGAGKSPYLTVTRREGWALTEWNGVPPAAMKELPPSDEGGDPVPAHRPWSAVMDSPHPTETDRPADEKSDESGDSVGN